MNICYFIWDSLQNLSSFEKPYKFWYEQISLIIILSVLLQKPAIKFEVKRYKRKEDNLLSHYEHGLMRQKHTWRTLPSELPI